MSEIDFDFEWIDPGAARGAELRATWARFELRVDGEPITRLSDLSSRSVRNSLYLPLYPLAEWIATNWWFLFFEIEAPGRDTCGGYSARHNIRTGAEGYALPSLSINPTGESILLDWTPIRLAAPRIEFLSQGGARFEAAQITEFFTNLIQVVLRRLDDLGVTSTLLHEEWQAISTADSGEIEFCAASAALGLDPYALDDPAQQQILSVGRLVPASVSQDFFAAARFPILADQANRLMQAIDLSRNNHANLHSVKKLRMTYAGGNTLAGSPWQQGYGLAQRLRRDLGLNGQVLVSLADVAASLSLSETDLAGSIFETPEFRAPFDAVVDVNNAGSPGFVISKRREEAIKFAFCRGLFEYLTSAHADPILVTRTRAERQKRSRAFAAEFLVPASTLRQRLTTDTVGEEEVDELAAEFHVAPHVVFHQLENHGIARIIPS
jgi:hypothetical protein